MKQVKLFVEDVAQGTGIDQTANLWLESMADTIEVESIQVTMGAGAIESGGASAGRAWPVAILIVYRSK
ncbi:MAG TPA: hypothetical protein VFJ58_12430 [Armatimonadota bacterium]|nr:hypothetical protein [Armatimonadota bacterium]